MKSFLFLLVHFRYEKHIPIHFVNNFRYLKNLQEERCKKVGFPNFHPDFLVLIVTEIISLWPKNSSYFYGPTLVFPLFFFFLTWNYYMSA